MGRKIFVSYKFRDDNVFPIYYSRINTVRTYVDELENYFDRTDDIYKGESDDEDLSYLKDDAIWEKLKSRIFDSSITIVMISPKMKEDHKYDKSQWIPWEISYSLKEMTRNDRTSHSNAILAVILPDRNNSYEYFVKENRCNNCSCRIFQTNTLFGILKNNMFNQLKKTNFDCAQGKSGIYSGDSSYIECVKWIDFISSPNIYIDKAIEIKNKIADYEVVKEV